MYQSILVPLDGSRRSERILPHVESLALKFDAWVLFLQVIEPTPVLAAGMDVSPTFDDTQQQHDRALSYLHGWRGEFSAKGLEAATVVEHGSVVRAIINVAEREDVDLIAMASHGRSGLGSVFYGSVTAGVLHRIDRPLLLIRSRDT